MQRNKHNNNGICKNAMHVALQGPLHLCLQSVGWGDQLQRNKHNNNGICKNAMHAAAAGPFASLPSKCRLGGSAAAEQA
eukprot:1159237-Pelagomonas_calceolata.AAC.1